MKPNRKAKAAKKTAKKGGKLTLIAQVYEQVKAYNFYTERTETKAGERVILYPKNAFAEKIVVEASRVDVGETHISLWRITGGERDTSLSFISNNSGRTESAALSIIKSELKRYC